MSDSVKTCLYNASLKLLRIGLTGGIGCGKSTSVEAFRELGAPVIDMDAVCRDLLALGRPELEQVRAAFGNRVARGATIDRAALRHLVFNEDSARRRLERILHPPAFREVEKWVRSLRDGSNDGYCVICIPLLVETDASRHVDRILVIDCPPEQQLQRARQRDHTRSIKPADDTEDIMRIQANRDQRLHLADDVIDNSGDLAALRRQVERYHRYYLDLSQSNNSASR